MKKSNLICFIFIGILLLFLSGSVYAQYTFSPSKVLFKNQFYNELSYDSIHIANNSATDTLKLKWELLQYDSINGTYIEFCASGNCYLGIPQSGSFPAIPPGGFGWAGVHFWTGYMHATAIAKVWIYKEGSIGIGDTLSYSVNAIEEVGFDNLDTENYSFSLFPNPASDFMHLAISNEAIGCELTVYSLIGEKVFSKKLMDLQNTVSLESLQNGFYFVEISNGISRKTFTLNVIK